MKKKVYNNHCYFPHLAHLRKRSWQASNSMMYANSYTCIRLHSAVQHCDLLNKCLENHTTSVQLLVLNISQQPNYLPKIPKLSIRGTGHFCRAVQLTTSERSDYMNLNTDCVTCYVLVVNTQRNSLSHALLLGQLIFTEPQCF